MNESRYPHRPNPAQAQGYYQAYQGPPVRAPPPQYHAPAGYYQAYQGPPVRAPPPQYHAPAGYYQAYQGPPVRAPPRQYNAPAAHPPPRHDAPAADHPSTFDDSDSLQGILDCLKDLCCCRDCCNDDEGDRSI